MTHASQCYPLQSSCLFLDILKYLTLLGIYEGSQTYMNVHEPFRSNEYILFILYVYVKIQLNTAKDLYEATFHR